MIINVYDWDVHWDDYRMVLTVYARSGHVLFRSGHLTCEDAKLEKQLIPNYELRRMRLTAGLTEGEVAKQVARLVAVQTGRELAIDGNYVSKLERGVITWPNYAYRAAFRTLFGVATDTELGFFPSRTRRDAERWQVLPTLGLTSLGNKT